MDSVGNGRVSHVMWGIYFPVVSSVSDTCQNLGLPPNPVPPHRAGPLFSGGPHRSKWFNRLFTFFFPSTACSGVIKYALFHFLFVVAVPASEILATVISLSQNTNVSLSLLLKNLKCTHFFT